MSNNFILKSVSSGTDSKLFLELGREEARSKSDSLPDIWNCKECLQFKTKYHNTYPSLHTPRPTYPQAKVLGWNLEHELPGADQSNIHSSSWYTFSTCLNTRSVVFSSKPYIPNTMRAWNIPVTASSKDMNTVRAWNIRQTSLYNARKSLNVVIPPLAMP